MAHEDDLHWDRMSPHSGVRAVGSAGHAAEFWRVLQSLWIAYQPIVDPKTRAPFGHEALMRSEEPGFPNPGVVLQVAEELNQVHHLGRTVRERAARYFPLAPDGSVLFVNLHPAELCDPDLFAPESPLSQAAERVVLEVTERATLARIPDLRERVSRLRELGFRVAIDDLGAGYSGLSSWAELQPEFIKLDMALVRDVDQSRIKQKMIRSLCNLAHGEGIVVVAEGVETRSERDMLLQLGADLLQGFLLARPGRPFPVVSW
jgi:EAL domain-containing protein (putative c-di-GMP-specific phosphodiesterase class I)